MHNLAEFSALGSHKATINMLDGAVVSSEVGLGRDMFPSPHGQQNSVPFSLLG